MTETPTWIEKIIATMPMGKHRMRAKIDRHIWSLGGLVGKISNAWELKVGYGSVWLLDSNLPSDLFPFTFFLL